MNNFPDDIAYHVFQGQIKNRSAFLHRFVNKLAFKAVHFVSNLIHQAEKHRVYASIIFYI